MLSRENCSIFIKILYLSEERYVICGPICIHFVSGTAAQSGRVEQRRFGVTLTRIKHGKVQLVTRINHCSSGGIYNKVGISSVLAGEASSVVPLMTL